MNPRLKLWAQRLGLFFFTVLGLCALGGLLGAISFPLVGRLAGSHKTTADLIVVGTKTGGFIFMVWAPGAALVRVFMHARNHKKSASP